MRDLTEKTYRATVIDGNERHVFLYRKPTNAELAAYQSSLFARKQNKVVQRVAQCRLKFGALVLQGFVKGTFGFDGKLIASDPGDPDYRPDWKELLVQHAPDIIGAIGKQAFEGTTVIAGEMDLGVDDELSAIIEELDLDEDAEGGTKNPLDKTTT